MTLRFESRFLKSAKKLPEATQEKLGDLLVLLELDPFHSLLHSKRLKGALSNTYSFRVQRDWRVTFCFDSKEVIRILDVDHRRNVYR